MTDDVLPAPVLDVSPPRTGRFVALAAAVHLVAAGAAVPLLLGRDLPGAAVGVVLALDGLAVLALVAACVVVVRGRELPGGGRTLLAVLVLAAAATGLRTAATGEPWAGLDAVATLAAALALRSQGSARLALAATAGGWTGGAVAALLRDPEFTAARLVEGVLPAAALLAVLVAVLSVHQMLDDQEQELQEALLTSAALSVRDHLTGTSNRRGLEMLAGPILENARRQGEAVHCLFVDVDGLREVNEDAGTAKGDAVLISVVQAVQASVRGTDVVGRWSGSEFVVLGPGTGTSPLEMERRVRAWLSEDPPVPPDLWSAAVSIGSATLVPWDDGDLTSLLRRADQDMQLRRTLRRQRTRRTDPVAPPGKPVPGGAEY